jgi:ribosome-binding protein aMBF1 (putative translation factor)
MASSLAAAPLRVHGSRVGHFRAGGSPICSQLTKNGTPPPASVRIGVAGKWNHIRCRRVEKRSSPLNIRKQLAGATKPFSWVDEDIRKQKQAIARTWTQQGPAMWDTHWFRSSRRTPSAEMKAKAKSEIDEYVGARIREGRLSLNLSQEQLARALGVSFQQIQNYERGNNGVSAVRLFEICRILNVSLVAMFPQDHSHDLLRPYTQPSLDHPARSGMTN